MAEASQVYGELRVVASWAGAMIGSLCTTLSSLMSMSIVATQAIESALNFIFSSVFRNI